MSLLMDALRKAEQAKKQEQTDPATPGAETSPGAEVTSPGPDDLDLRLEVSEEPMNQAPAQPEENAPDFILSLEEPQVEAESPAPMPKVVTAAKMAPSVPPPLPAAETSEKVSGEMIPPGSNRISPTSEPASPQLPDNRPTAGLQRDAHNFFAAKNEELQRRGKKRLVVLALTLAGGIALGVAAYFFYNSQQPANLVTPLVVTRQDAQQPVAPLPAAAQAPAPETQSQDALATNSGPASSGGGETAGAAKVPAVPAVPPVTGSQETPAPKPPGLPPAAKTKEAASQAPDLPPVIPEKITGPRAASSSPATGTAPPPAKPTFTKSRSDGIDAVDSSLLAAHAAYQRGDIQEAGNHYLQVLRTNSAHRGAMLGLAAIAVQRGELTSAKGYYLRLLDLDPSDPLAMTGLLSITPVNDPARRESDLKLLLVKNPNIATLHFNLGNLYASQQRWSEAQHSYFRAVETAMKSGRQAEALPDYYYNLAVSLDRLGQPRLAAGYYQEALQSLNGRTAGFAAESARLRIEQIRNLAQGEQKLPDTLP